MTTASETAGQAYDRISKLYDLIADPAEHAARDRGVALLNAQEGEAVLEVGAGTGRGLLAFAAVIGPSGVACGLDVSAGMLALARQRLGTSEERVFLQQGDGRSLPYRSTAFDAVFMSFTLELFGQSDIQGVLAEVRRVLKPSGRLGVVSLTIPSEPNLAVSAYEWLHRCLPHWIDCRPIDVLGQLSAGGFRTTDTDEMRLWGLSVIAALALPGGEGSPS